MPYAANHPSHLESVLDVFETSIGWMVVKHVGTKIQGIKFGYQKRADGLRAFAETRGQTLESVDNRAEALTDSTRHHSHGVNTPWRDALVAYGEGRDVRFTGIELDMDWMTPFQHSVSTACREIPRGQTVTYGGLAVLANSRGAAQAVGTVMKTNRFPIIIPCHRVVAASGLGGYSAGAGIKTKRMLLELENASSHPQFRPLFD